MGSVFAAHLPTADRVSVHFRNLIFRSVNKVSASYVLISQFHDPPVITTYLSYIWLISIQLSIIWSIWMNSTDWSDYLSRKWIDGTDLGAMNQVRVNWATRED